MSIGLSENKAKDTVKNPTVSSALESLILEVCEGRYMLTKLLCYMEYYIYVPIVFFSGSH